MADLNPSQLVERLLDGDRRALARLLTYVDDGAPGLRQVIATLHPRTGGARIVGVTGAPGVGKSTITDRLVGHWRDREQRVAVLAVDPSSPLSGGALLGDRVRMQHHALDRGVYIRSMASRGHLGGLSWAAPQAVLILDAAGFDVVVVETVGVGQAEVDVAGLADTTVVVVAPGMGDAVQAAKAGILEVADVYCVNKADRDGAERAVKDLRDMLHVGHLGGSGHLDQPGHGGWVPPVRKTTALTSEGIAALVEEIDRHGRWLIDSGQLAQRRRKRAGAQVRELALAAVRTRFQANDGLLSALAAEVAEGRLDPYAAADRLVAALPPG